MSTDYTARLRDLERRSAATDQATAEAVAAADRLLASIAAGTVVPDQGDAAR